MGTFGYHVVYLDKAPGPIVNVIAEWVEAEAPLRAVLWSSRKGKWIYAPGPAARLIYDDMRMDEHDPVDRATAERTAREVFGVELPSEEELHRIFLEGARKPHL